MQNQVNKVDFAIVFNTGVQAETLYYLCRGQLW
jgi:hypothetical protein